MFLRDIATLRTDLPLIASVDDLLWKGPTPAFPLMANHLDNAKFSKKLWARTYLALHRCIGIGGRLLHLLIDAVCGHRSYTRAVEGFLRGDE